MGLRTYTIWAFQCSSFLGSILENLPPKDIHIQKGIILEGPGSQICRYDYGQSGDETGLRLRNSELSYHSSKTVFFTMLFTMPSYYGNLKLNSLTATRERVSKCRPSERSRILTSALATASRLAAVFFFFFYIFLFFFFCVCVCLCVCVAGLTGVPGPPKYPKKQPLCPLFGDTVRYCVHFGGSSSRS